MPIADEFKVFASTTYEVLNAVDEFRRKYGMKNGQFIPVTLTEVAEKSDLSVPHARRIVDGLVEAGWVSFEAGRGFIQHKTIPQLKPVRQ